MSFWGIPISIVATPTNPTDTDVSTIDTLAKMALIARAEINSPKVVQAVGECISTPYRTKRDLVRRIYLWIRGHVSFEEDEIVLGQVLNYQDTNQELLISPSVLLSMPRPMGDCDDYSTLAAAMLLHCNVPVKFVVIAIDDVTPWKFGHVYCSAYLDDEHMWVGFDASHGKVLGWEYSGHVYRRGEWLV